MTKDQPVLQLRVALTPATLSAWCAFTASGLTLRNRDTWRGSRPDAGVPWGTLELFEEPYAAYSGGLERSEATTERITRHLSKLLGSHPDDEIDLEIFRHFQDVFKRVTSTYFA